MSVVEGLVAVTMPSKFDASITRVKLEDHDSWYSAESHVSDKIRKGATVKLKVETRGRDVFVSKVKEIAPPAAGGGKGGYKGGGGGKGGMSKEEWAAKDESIRYQSARNAAIELLKIKQELGLLKLGTKAAGKVPMLMAVLDLDTAAFYADVENKGAVVRVGTQADESDEFEDEPTAPAEDEDFDDDDDTDDDDF